MFYGPVVRYADGTRFAFQCVNLCGEITEMVGGRWMGVLCSRGKLDRSFHAVRIYNVRELVSLEKLKGLVDRLS